MKDTAIDAKNQRMLELLAQGSTSRVIARQMGYQEGTMRVYLHNLYRRIGVANKTEAVVWYLNRERLREGAPAAPAPRRMSSGGDLFGEMALDESLFAALGVMSYFVGPYARGWEVAKRLEGVEIDARTQERRVRGRALWRALLKGDWALGKHIYDQDQGAAISLDSPTDAVLLAALLIAGGYSLAADRLVSQLTDKRKAGRAVSAREAGLMRALRDAFQAPNPQAIAALQRLATEKGGIRQLALVLVFHALKAAREEDRARQAAGAIWAEAEMARKQLEAMGERPLAGGITATAPAKAGAREKATAAR
jgi:DNA-binding CsgD family transcriptional regulator